MVFNGYDKKNGRDVNDTKHSLSILRSVFIQKEIEFLESLKRAR
jgi:hypothetical protein